MNKISMVLACVGLLLPLSSAFSSRASADTLQCQVVGSASIFGPESFLIVTESATAPGATGKAVVMAKSDLSDQDWQVVAPEASYIAPVLDGPGGVDGSNLPAQIDWNSSRFASKCFVLVKKYHFVFVKRPDRIFGNFTVTQGVAQNPNPAGSPPCVQPTIAPTSGKPRAIECTAF